MRLFTVDDPDHAHATEVLPWYVNGTLDPVEHCRVEHHVAECAACRGELDMLYELQAAVQTDESKVGETEPLARIQVRLAAEHRQGPVRGGWLRRQWMSASLWTRVALTAQFAVIAVLTGAVIGVDRSPPAAYRTLTSPPLVVSGEDRVLVVFDDGATQAGLRELLQRAHAQVVDGPNSVGAFSLRVPRGELTGALEQLRASPYVRLAEPAAPGAAAGP